MVTVGFLTLSVGLAPLVILFALGRLWTLEVAYVRISWVPVLALAVQAILVRPMAHALSYAFIIPPLLTCIVSLFFGIVGATLLAGRPRSERRPGLLRAAVLASVPGALLVGYIVVSFAWFFVTR